MRRIWTLILLLLITTLATGQHRPFEGERRRTPRPPADTTPAAPVSPRPAEPAPTATAPRELFRNPIDEVTVEYTAAQVAQWPTQTIDERPCRVSPAITFPLGWELNHHRVLVAQKGSAAVNVAIAHHSADKFSDVLEKKHLRRPWQRASEGKELTFTSPYKGESTAWILLDAADEAQITAVHYRCLRGRGTLYGHTPVGDFRFAEVQLPYRLLAPRVVDEQQKYPLVISIPTSGGVGQGDVKPMEMVNLSRFLYEKYFLDDRFACYSLTAVILDGNRRPAPYWPKGPRGGVTPDHPDFPHVNAEGWYTQAMLALIEKLLADPAYRIDPERIYYAGFSYGGKGCWEFLQAAPQRFAAAISVGGWPIGPVASNPSAAQKAAFAREAQAYKHVPIRIFAGEKDPLSRGSRAAGEVLQQLGADCAYTEFAGTDHVPSAGKTWGDVKTIEWLFEQKRTPTALIN